MMKTDVATPGEGPAPQFVVQPQDAPQLAAILKIAMHHTASYSASPIDTETTVRQILCWIDQLEAL